MFQKNKIKDFLVGQKEEDKIKKKTTEAKQQKNIEKKRKFVVNKQTSSFWKK